MKKLLIGLSLISVIGVGSVGAMQSADDLSLPTNKLNSQNQAPAMQQDSDRISDELMTITPEIFNGLDREKQVRLISEIITDPNVFAKISDINVYNRVENGLINELTRENIESIGVKRFTLLKNMIGIDSYFDIIETVAENILKNTDFVDYSFMANLITFAKGYFDQFRGTTDYQLIDSVISNNFIENEQKIVALQALRNHHVFPYSIKIPTVSDGASGNISLMCKFLSGFHTSTDNSAKKWYWAESIKLLALGQFRPVDYSDGQVLSDNGCLTGDIFDPDAVFNEALAYYEANKDN